MIAPLALGRYALHEVRTGRFRRTMAVLTGFSAVVSGLEAYVQHTRGDFSDPWMWTPVWLTGPAAGAAGAAIVSDRAARTVLPVVSAASLADGAIGFALHVRGIRRMPGGFHLGQYNVVMGPPIFAPLLMTSVGVLGLLASALRPEGATTADALARRIGAGRVTTTLGNAAASALDLAALLDDVPALHGSRLSTAIAAAADEPAGLPRPLQELADRIAEGQFQRVLALTAAGFGVLAGGEAYLEHLRGSLNDPLMWTPVLVTPPMVAAAVAAALDPEAASTVLPAAAAVAFADGILGFGLHLRGIRRMPGGFSNLRFNVTLGPPLFAPLLFTSVGLLGMLASILRRRS